MDTIKSSGGTLGQKHKKIVLVSHRYPTSRKTDNSIRYKRMG